MNALSTLEESYSFKRPGDIVGDFINQRVALLATAKLSDIIGAGYPDDAGREKAVEILCDKATRHAYDRVKVEFTPAAKNALEAIAREISSALVAQLFKDGAVKRERFADALSKAPAIQPPLDNGPFGGAR